MAILRGMSGDFQGQVFELEEGENTVGRHESNVIPVDDFSVSSFHACIIKDGGKYTLRDLDSTNGTRINGQKISVRRLEPGLIIQFGSLEMMFEGEDVEVDAPVKAPPVKRAEPLEDGAVVEDAAAPSESFKPRPKYEGKAIWIAIGVLGGVAMLGVVALVITLLGLG